MTLAGEVPIVEAAVDGDFRRGRMRRTWFSVSVAREDRRGQCEDTGRTTQEKNLKLLM